MGVHKLIQSAEDLFNLFKAYKTETKENPIKVVDFVGKDARRVYRDKERPLTMEGFECYVGSIEGMPMSLEQYFSNREDRYSEFADICLRIKTAIRADQIEGGMAGIYNPSITQRLNGLTDKSESTIITEQPLFGDD